VNLLDGNLLAKTIKQELATKVEQRKALGLKIPHLAAIIVGHNPASKAYVNNKVKSCHEAGFKSSLIELSDTISQSELIHEVRLLNSDPEIDGFIVQLPLPSHIDEQEVTLAIEPMKDVDGFHPSNFGRMCLGLPCYLPATPFGILEMLRRNSIETSGKHAVVVGRSNIVGTPMSILLSRKGWDCTVTLAHSKTKNLSEVCASADILVAAIGIPNFITSEMVKPGAVILDVGINRIDAPDSPKGSRLVGDVDFKNVAPKCSWITPVPGGIGPLTVAGLMINTMSACEGIFHKHD
jgi:methylenetetrahydrofolate dehydrogenase (NADP+) / methenyltetrahydrofolate cyclohydrolase